MLSTVVLCVLLSGAALVPACQAQALDLDDLVQQSDAVVLATVVGYVSPSAQKDTEVLPNVEFGGDFAFNTVRALKGNVPSTFDVNYLFFTGPSISYFILYQPGVLQKGDSVILFLKSANGAFQPTAGGMPYVKVVPVDSFDAGATVDTAVTDLLINSLGDARLRLPVTGVLSSVIGAKVVVAMAQHLDDLNQKVKENVMTCLEYNQQVAVIPFVERDAERQVESNVAETAAVSNLRLFKVKDAVPCLNRLLFSPIGSVRLSAIDALSDLADQSSAPYLILALRDPDPSFQIPRAARRTLALDVVFEPQPYEDETNFAKYFASEELKMYAWWSDDLLGKHLDRREGDQVVQVQEADQPLPVDASDINPLLFEPYPTLRERVIVALEQKANSSSVPYLVLALQDPDPTVSYDAYKILLKMIGGSGSPCGEAQYGANQNAATKPIYDWWTSRLLLEERHESSLR